MSNRPASAADASDGAGPKLHIEVTPLGPADTVPKRLGAHRQRQIWRPALVGSIVLLTVALLASGFLPLHTPLTGWALPSPPTATSLPSPTAALMGNVPASCPPANANRPFANLYGPGVSVFGAHIWLVGFDGPAATLHYAGTGAPHTPLGWPHKLLLAAGNDITQPITLKVQGLGRVTGDVAFSTGSMASGAPTLTLDPNQQAPGANGLHGWPLTIFVPSEGCYFLAVSYGGNETSGTYFAAGL